MRQRFWERHHVDLSVLYPQFEEQLDLPAHCQHHQRFCQVEQPTWHIGHHNEPARQVERLFAGLAPMITRLSTQALSSLLGHLLRHPLHNQSRGDPRSLTEQHTQFHAGSRPAVARARAARADARFAWRARFPSADV